MMLAAVVTLLLGPWKGPSLPTASAAAAKYRLAVRGPAERKVQLRTGALPQGWVASFCTESICSPFAYQLDLDDRGQGEVEFQAIRTDPSAPAHIRITISADGANSKSLTITAR